MGFSPVTSRTPTSPSESDSAGPVPPLKSPGVSMVRRKSLAILSQAVCIRNLQLLGQVLHHDCGNVGGFWQECAQKANGAKLNGVSQPIVSTAVRSDLGSIMIVQEEVPG